MMAVVGPAAAAHAAGTTAHAQVQQQISEQLKRVPGGVIHGNSIHYAAGDITITYQPKAAAGTVRPHTLGQCPANNMCLYRQTYYNTIYFTTGSEWCPTDQAHGMAEPLDFGRYGIPAPNSIYNQSPYYARGENPYFDWSGAHIETYYVLNPGSGYNGTNLNATQIETCPTTGQFYSP
jgi:hypothetical protein